MKPTKNRLFGIAVTAVVFVAMVAAATGGVGPTEKQKDIRRLMDLSGAGDLGMQVWNQMVVSFKQSLPQVPDAFWQECKKEISSESLVALCIPIYDKNLTHDDIKELIRFYETPAGKRIIKALPLIAQESTQVGQKWGQDIAQKVLKKLQEKGYR